MTESSNVENINELSFEEAMVEMENTVKCLEEGNLSLDKSLEEFEYGIKLSRYLHDKLRSAEMRINELIKESGEIMESRVEVSASRNEMERGEGFE